MSKRNIIILAIVGLVGGTLALCLFCGLIGMLTDDSSAPAAIATLPPLESAPTEEPTPSPTPIPVEPTATPQPPTATPEPVQPTATPLPPEADPNNTFTASSEEYSAYFLDTGNNVSEIGAAIGELSNLLLNADFGNDDWTFDVALQITRIRLGHEALEELTVPAGLEGFHVTLLDATSDCNQMTDHLTTGLDTFDTSEIETASTFMISCGQKMADINESLTTVIDQIE